MLQVTAARIRAAWPDATLNVMTANPAKLDRVLPGANPVSVFAPRQLLSEGCLFGRIGVRVPQPEALVRNIVPNMALHLTGSRMRLRRIETAAYDEFAEHLKRADLVVAAGGGYVNDIFPLTSTYTLRLLEFASSMGKPTAMLGQGLGPSISSDLRAACTAAFPRLNLLTLREAVKSLDLSRELGAREDRTYVTGDDAIELTRHVSPDPKATGLGLGIRYAEYSKLSTAHIKVIRDVLQRKAAQYDAPLVGVPISFFDHEQDHRIIDTITSGYDKGEPTHSPQTPQDITRRVIRCRVVVTGTYHAAVFALACGVPVVAFSASDYYHLKFSGLARQFSTGCVVLDATNRDFPTRLSESIDSLWRSREEFIGPLREAALIQADAAQSAFNTLCHWV